MLGAWEESLGRMLDTWEESLGHECPTMKTSPIMVDRDNGSACWTLGREV